jgi:hypothetical protein
MLKERYACYSQYAVVSILRADGVAGQERQSPPWDRVTAQKTMAQDF